MEKLIIFDLDGTLAEPESHATFRRRTEPYVWMEGRLEKLEALDKQGIHFAICTNQGGISAGHLDYDETVQAIHGLLSPLPFPIPWLMCPYVATYRDSEKWKTFASWRKPSPVMLLMLAAQFPHISHDAILCVGDRDEDKFAAWNAGFAFKYTFSYFAAHQVKPTEDIPF